MLGWLWKKGRARLKTLAELPQIPLQIPQPDGTRVPIVLKKVDCPGKKLGIYVNPHMRTTSLCVMRLPICKFVCLTPRMHTGTPRMMHTGTSF
jgi:hypothetical protein